MCLSTLPEIKYTKGTNATISLNCQYKYATRQCIGQRSINMMSNLVQVINTKLSVNNSQ